VAEETLQNAPFACVVVSHDRYFLENVANEMVELNAAYDDGRCGSPGITARFWRPRNSTCTRKGTGRRRWRIACIRKSSGCGAGPKREPQNRRRALIKRTK